MNGSGPSKRVLFRADASVEIGTGHIMRCVTLADAMRRRGAEVVFACRTLPGDLNDWLCQQGYTVWAWQSAHAADWQPFAAFTVDQEPFDWLVVDHYALDLDWERQARTCARRSLVIDDLADRPHACDWLLDQNDLASEGATPRYGALVPSGYRTLLGPEYALLRPDFSEWRARVLAENRREALTVREVLVFFGGSDPTGETFKTLEALKPLAGQIQTTVITGVSNPRREEIQAFCSTLPQTDFLCQVNNMAERMARADLAIGAGGTATWERLCLGLPSLVISVADNQRDISARIARLGAQQYLGPSAAVLVEDIRNALDRLLTSPEDRMALARSALALVDGQGVNRVLQALGFTDGAGAQSLR
ncbi:MAG: pseG [Vampirovibrio sp.]|nr:pseG [Vampirovibrio sp.]